MRRATSWKCTAPPRCRTGTATGSRACWAAAGRGAALRGPCRRRLRHSRRNLSRRRAGLRGRAEIQTADQMDRGPARAPDRRQSFAPAASPRPRRDRNEGRILGIEDEFFHDNGAYMRTHAATVPDLAAAMLPAPIACRLIARPATSASQTRRLAALTAHPDVTNRLSCASACSMRSPPKIGMDAVEIRRRNLIGKSAMPYSARPRHTRHQIMLRFRRLRAAARQDTRSGRWTELRRAAQRTPRTKGEKVGAGVAMFVEKSGLGPFDTVRVEVRPERQRRGDHRRRLDRTRRGNRDRADLRRCARRRLHDDPGHSRPDRPHRKRHGRVRLTRDRHVRRSHAARGDQAACSGAACRSRTDADECRCAQHRRTARSCAPTARRSVNATCRTRTRLCRTA